MEWSDSMFQVGCLNTISEKGLNILGEGYHLTKDIHKAEVLLVRSASMHELEIPSNVLAIARAGAGVNNIPLERCSEQGIVVFNTPGANANSVKELVLAGLLLASRDVLGGIEWVVQHREDKDIAAKTEAVKKRFSGKEIQEKTIGVIGLGAVGSKVANAAVHLGMHVLGYDPYLSVDAAWNIHQNVEHVTELKALLQRSDFITLHVPATECNKNMINEASILQMKAGVVLLNFARNQLCDETAILKALESGKIARYVTDFPNSNVAGHPKCIVLPHLGASTNEAEENCAIMAVKEIKDYLEYGTIQHAVNYPDCSMGACKGVCRITILHRNIANMISRLTACIGTNHINISEFVNKSRGAYAYTMMDVEQPISKEILQQLRNLDGVLKVRTIVC